MLKPLLYDWGGVNAALFDWINRLHAPLWDRFMLLGTALADHTNFPYYLALLALIGLVATRRRGTVESVENDAAMRGFFCAVTVFALAYVIDGWVVTWLKAALDFPRPAAVFGVANIVVVGSPQYRHSFPSGHTSFAALFVASAWPLLHGWQRVLAVLFVVWVMLSRVSLGDHFPADVLAGALLSLAIVVIVRWFSHRLHGAPAKP